jgi:hypothetical protein
MHSVEPPPIHLATDKVVLDVEYSTPSTAEPRPRPLETVQCMPLNVMSPMDPHFITINLEPLCKLDSYGSNVTKGPILSAFHRHQRAAINSLISQRSCMCTCKKEI